MSQELTKGDTPEERELFQKREELSGLQVVLAQRELDLATLQAELNAFERRYFRIVGVLYAELDEIEAQIAERLSSLSPRDPELQKQAAEGRARANESARASQAFQCPTARGEQFKPNEALKKLYRDVAKCLHPDLATDENDRVRRERFMAEANRAYEEGDEARLRDILREWKHSPDAIKGDGVAAELVRMIRQLAQVRERLRIIETAIERLRSSTLYKLNEQVERAEAEGKDLLAEMALRLDRQTAEAKERLAGLVQEQAKHG